METALAGRPVFVTGATGFIGRRLVAALVAAGADVGVLTRSRSGLRDLPKGVRPVIGALTDEAALARALSGTAVLFNLAYDVRATAAANLAGFERLLSAARSARVGRIVHLSSIVVYDAWPAADCSEAGSTGRPGGSAYRQAKIAMEKRLLAQPLPAAILEPTIVYGPGSALWTDGFATALLAGGVVLPEPEGLCNGVFVEDVVQACLKAATLPDLGRERFVISGPEPFPWSALLQGYARALGRGEVFRVPAAELLARLGPKPDETTDRAPSAAARVSAILRRAIGHRRFEALMGAIRRRSGKTGRLEPDHHLLEEFTGRGTCRIDHARRRLGYAPEFDLAAGLAATADDLKRMAG
ncbi:MAG: NAD-dependent epimerase/dehydratase family protein [Rhodobacteraceae bacterium]|jgi:nucleoside-diphosphate-sugar epimerase|uniref:NAD-dependent epimerase/dehydratase family protein n=1 Tax=Albidovulum sp. TaxID=1872424 RepID=UPI001DB217A9|nr:NAD-dependent epimerase/dehydratase family protein [uncultured Defluviimonas sp.]MCB2126477.1 NAD-dependent epimerase/dehydratase family protein [Paracoccaceae bacterium]MCC0068710.1 NAD-dependent epimerase/dehydratase family protein [Paracoccaceae bacterium]